MNRGIGKKNRKLHSKKPNECSPQAHSLPIMTPTKSSCSHATPHYSESGQFCLTKWKMALNDQLHLLRDLFRKARKITPTWTRRLWQLCSACENFTNTCMVAPSPYSRTTSPSNTFSTRIEESQQWHRPGYSVGLLH